MDLPAMGKEASQVRQGPLREDPEAEADKEILRLGMEKEETESSDDNTTQYSIHPPFDFPYFLLLQGYSHRQVSHGKEGTLTSNCHLLKRFEFQVIIWLGLFIYTVWSDAGL